MASTTRRRRSSYNALPRWMTGKRIVATVSAVVLLVVVVFGVRVAFGLAHAFHTNPVNAVIQALSGGGGSSVDQQKKDLHRINIMVYGYGGDGHSGAYLSDSMMLISIQPQASGPPEVAEISIPRDWYVPIQLKGQKVYQRLNAAYAYGMDGQGPEPTTAPDAGAAVADPTIENLLGVHIDYFVGVDFTAFKSAVDAVGGIDIDVQRSFTDTQYPHGECDQGDCSYETVHFDAGWQHMNGATALIFARSRHGDNGEGSDFARSKRQQLVIAALKQKVESLGGIGSLPDLLNALGDNVLTNLSIGDAESLFGLVKDVAPATIEHVSIDDTNFLYDCGYPSNCGAYYLYAHDSTFQTLHHFISGVFVPVAARNEQASVVVEDASGRGVGASGRWSQLLGELGLKTSDGGTVSRQAVTQVIDQSGGKDTQTAQWLAQFFGVSVTTQTPAPAPTGTAQAAPSVTVVLGTAEESAFLDNPGTG